MKRKAAVFVSQSGTPLTQREKKSIIDSFPSNPLKEREFFTNMVESLSLQGLRPTQYFGYKLKCVDGRPVWNDTSAARNKETLFNNQGARTALENVSITYADNDKTKLYEKSNAIDLNVMIASFTSGKVENAAFAIRYEFEGNALRLGGALFVSSAFRFNKMVISAHDAFVRSNDSDAFVSTG
ncbi:MAG: hypothetical protein NTX79_02685 [Candidatus Micrarchaeota archaeon]|nr:hypothetical protein [Candidatus Micrarchaeota archaeon]